MKYLELKEDPIIIEWLDTLAARPNTERNYIFAMQKYTDYTDKSPETLLHEAEEDIRAGKLMRERQVKKQLIGYRKHLEKREHTPKTIKTHLAGVRSFYRMFDIDLPTLPRSTQRARPEKKRTEIPTKDEIREVLNLCNVREKALLLVGLSSGLSANEIRKLRISTF
jgi:integrase